ncbi:MAG: iron ABC transporter permease [Bacteroidetes bacterium]|nr:iron ABC transporter permease [Bacteroidota bacterium]
MSVSKQIGWLIIGLIALIGASCAHALVGETAVSFSTMMEAIFQYDRSVIDHVLFREFRLCRTLTAILAGSSLALSGMLMQTLFNNPLAGPYILGINSGASLFVGLLLMSGISIGGAQLGIVGAALLGAFVSCIFMIGLSGYLRNQISLLLAGMMFGSFTSAILSILQQMSGAEALKAFTMWSMGTLQQVSFEELSIFASAVSTGLVLALVMGKFLNVLVLGEKPARLLGVNIVRTRVIILMAVAILAGVTTAFCGPIAFVGMAVPNLTRLIFKTQQHHLLIGMNLLFGALFVLICDTLILHWSTVLPIPLNAFTSLIGAPFVLLILMRRVR